VRTRLFGFFQQFTEALRTLRNHVYCSRSSLEPFGDGVRVRLWVLGNVLRTHKNPTHILSCGFMAREWNACDCTQMNGFARGDFWVVFFFLVGGGVMGFCGLGVFWGVFFLLVFVLGVFVCGGGGRGGGWPLEWTS